MISKTAPSGGSPLRAAIAAAVAAQSMVFSLAVNLSPPDNGTRLVLHGVLAAAAVGVFLLVGRPVWTAAFQAARHGRIVMEQLFLTGILAAFGASLVATVTRHGHVYYEVVSVLLAIYTFGTLVGNRRRVAALSAARSWENEFDSCARIAPDGQTRTVPAHTVQAGDHVRVRAGEAIAVDGIVEFGTASVDETPLTGEPLPAVRRPGDAVWAGSRAIDGDLEIRVASHTRRLDGIMDRLREAQSSPCRLEREADRLVAWFLPLVMLIAAVTFLGWTLHSGWITGLFNALAVILVACPCSMGIATPIAVWSALARLARSGIVAHTSDLVERLARIDAVAFDKTGTLGDPCLARVDFVCAEKLDRRQLLEEIAALEAAATHPIARALQLPGHHPPAENVRLLPGLGIEGVVNGVTLQIGNQGLPGNFEALRKFLRETEAGTHEVRILRNGEAAGIALLREQLRAAARPVIAELECAGITCTVLTGDRAEAAALHDFRRVEAGLTPLEKAARVRELSARHRVLMVGDGVNDAPAMAEAHASLCLTGGSGVARETAMGGIADLRSLPLALAACRKALRTVRSNLHFAAVYNGVGISLAAAGILHPVAAALLMLASSLTVSFRALREIPEKFPLHDECAVQPAPAL